MAYKILIVDDEKVFSNYLEQILTRKGFQTKVAHNGEEAFAFYEQGAYDLVMTDIKMPKMGGLELLKAVHDKSQQPGNERWAEMAFVIMTAHGSVETAVEAMKLGASDYITKPFNAQEVLLVIEKVFEQAEPGDYLLLARNAEQAAFESFYGVSLGSKLTCTSRAICSSRSRRPRSTATW